MRPDTQGIFIGNDCQFNKSPDCVDNSQSHVDTEDGVIRPGVGATAHAIIAVSEYLNAQLIVLLKAKKPDMSCGACATPIDVTYTPQRRGASACVHALRACTHVAD